MGGLINSSAAGVLEELVNMMFNRQAQPDGPPHIADMRTAKHAEWLHHRGRRAAVQPAPPPPAQPVAIGRPHRCTQSRRTQQAGFNAILVQLAHIYAAAAAAAAPPAARSSTSSSM
ncbi:hypothetical protein PLESTB_001942400 [Pleodorina starrii]|uniref:Uncharacterized protein n=1 Tax=Pleodorina starrii TaxID=330485 RepID=A0A9W6C2Q6_9CHLO|nr:hypothetical protein PLESTB_001942400 [Pleodorina starrii]